MPTSTSFEEKPRQGRKLKK